MSTEKDLEWWKISIIYQVYPRSFCDSNGDGIGDLKGVMSKLEYLQYLKVGAIWFNPFYPSPMKDFGYDVSDYCDIDPIFGTLQDFDELVEHAHKRGVKIIIDLVANHTSDQHVWFQKSCRRQAPYDDYYVWQDGKRDEEGKLVPPNNWLSVFGGTAWRWHEGRGQYYYTSFIPEQPDLNFRNPDVVREMNDVLRFWLARGVDGVRVDALEQLYEAEHLQDEPRSYLPDVPPFQFEYLDHIYTREQPEIGDVVRGWRRIMQEFEQTDGQSRWIVVETYGLPKVRNRFYDYGSNPFNHDLVDYLTAPLSGTKIQALIREEYDNLPENGWPTFVIGNHDRERVSTKFGAVYSEALNMLLLTLRGTPCTYYGEELGMLPIEVSFRQTQDPWGINFGPERYQEFSRDPCRSPMQWTSSRHAGFTTGSSPWLPVHTDYTERNVKTQRTSPTQTPVQLYSALAALRQQPAFQRGDLLFSHTDDNVISYVRQLSGSDDAHEARYLVVLNFGRKSCKNDYSASPVKSEKGVVVEATSGLAARVKGEEMSLQELELQPGEGIVFKMV